MSSKYPNGHIFGAIEPVILYIKTSSVYGPDFGLPYGFHPVYFMKLLINLLKAKLPNNTVSVSSKTCMPFVR